MIRICCLAILLSSGVAWAGAPFSPHELFPRRANAPGAHTPAPVAVPEGARLVRVVIDAEEFTVPAARFGLVVDAQVDGVWHALLHSRGQAVGKARDRPIVQFVSLPPGATHVRVTFAVGKVPATFGATLEFVP